MTSPQTASPRSIESLLAEAVFRQQQADYPRAESLFREVLAREPTQPDALHYLGLLAYQTGRTDWALQLLHQSLTQAPENAVFHHNLANVLTQLNRWQEAIPHYQRSLERQPANADAWQGLALALRALGHPEDAVACLERGLAANAAHLGCWLALSDTQASLGLLPEAVEACRQAKKLAPQDPELGVRLATLLSEQGQHAEARALLDAAVAAAPDLPVAHYQKGVLLSVLGRFDEARAAFETALTLAPDFFQVCVHLAAIKTYALDDPLVRRLESLAHRAEWSEPGQGINVHFALGKICQDHGDYRRAFEHFLAGNRLRRSLLDYSTASQRAAVREIQALFDESFLRRAARAGTPSEVPVFIVGMPRSGTTLIEQILASHPQVHGGGELTLLHAALRRRLGARYRLDFVRGLAGLSDAELCALGSECLAQMRALSPSALRITDKMPSNFMLVGLIHVLYPEARIIHCRRDPLDTCVSCFTTLFKNGHEFTSDLAELGEYYRLYEELMAHWRRVLPAGVMLEIRYEDLVSDAEPQARRLLAHCGLEWDPACLRFHASRRAVGTASLYQARQPLYRSAVGRWRHYSEHLAPLRAALMGSAEEQSLL